MNNDITLLPLLRRWWRVLLLGAFLAGIAAFVLASWATPTYRAELKLLVGPISADAGDLEASGELGRTYSELAVSRPVLNAAIRSAGARNVEVDQLKERVTATSNEISRIVSVAVENEDARVAARLAGAIGERLKRLSSDSPSQETEAVEDFMRQAEISGLKESQRLAVERAAKRSFGQSLAGRVQVVDPPNEPTAPSGPMVPLMTLLAMLVGVLAAGVIVAVRESSAEAIGDQSELSAIDGARFLGSVDAPRTRDPDRALPVWTMPESTSAERYRLLAAKMGFLGGEPPLRSLLVVDANGGETGAGVAANLAAILMEAECRVLLVDANTSGGALTTLLQLEGEPGYTDLLERSQHAELNGEVADLLVNQGERLDVLPLGVDETFATVDLERAHGLLARLAAAADIVVISAPPIHRSPAALLWAQVVDGVLLAVEEGHTSLEAVTDALHGVALAKGRTVGTVLAHTRAGPGLRNRLRKLSEARRGGGAEPARDIEGTEQA